MLAVEMERPGIATVAAGIHCILYSVYWSTNVLNQET